MIFKNILFTSIFLQTLSTHGQNLFIGLKGGVSFTNVNDNSFNDKTFKSGLSTGLTFDFLFRNNISLSSDILYSQKGFGNGNYFIFGDAIGPNGFSPGGRKVVFFHYDYLSFPLNIGYTIGQTFFWFGNLGVIPSYLVSARTAFNDGTSIDNTEKVSKVELAGQIELGCGYKIKESYLLCTSVSYVQGFNYLSNQNYFANSNIRNYGVTVSLGIKYKLTHR